MEKTDKKLYEEFLAGNNQSFENIILRYKNSLIYFISRYTKNIEIAEDISQDVFVYILLHKHKYNFNYPLKTFLFLIAKSRALNYLKSSKHTTELNNTIISDTSLEEKLFSKYKLEEVKLTIDKMKTEYQVIIYLADFEKFSYKDISKIMKKTETQVKNLLHNARLKLYNLLKQEGISYED